MPTPQDLFFSLHAEGTKGREEYNQIKKNYHAWLAAHNITSEFLSIKFDDSNSSIIFKESAIDKIALDKELRNISSEVNTSFRDEVIDFWNFRFYAKDFKHVESPGLIDARELRAQEWNKQRIEGWEEALKLEKEWEAEGISITSLNQEEAKATKKKEVLRSEGFSTCTAFLLYSPTTQERAFAHVSPDATDQIEQMKRALSSILQSPDVSYVVVSNSEELSGASVEFNEWLEGKGAKPVEMICLHQNQYLRTWGASTMIDFSPNLHVSVRHFRSRVEVHHSQPFASEKKSEAHPTKGTPAFGHRPSQDSHSPDTPLAHG